MRKVLIALVVLFLSSPVAFGQYEKQLKKEMKKEYKSTMKRYKKEGWKLFGSPRSLEVTLLKYYTKINALEEEEKGYPIVGTSRAKSKNVLHNSALNAAAVKYAQIAGQKLKGRIVRDMSNDGDNIDSEFDRFYGAYESLVEKEIKGELQPNYSIYREMGDGSYEMEAYFIINEEAATKARLRAYENAARESEAAQKYAKQVADFVREGFNPTEESK